MTDLVASYLKHLKAAGSSDRTIEERGFLLRRLHRDLPLGLYEVTTDELEDWLANEDWGRATRATYYGHLVGFYRWASHPQRSIGLQFDPTVGLVAPPTPAGRPRPVTTHQLAVARSLLPQPYRLYIELAAFAGLRAVEISRLDREDVSKGELIVRRGKGDKPRVVLVSPDLWLAVQELPYGPVARTVRGTRASPRRVDAQTNENLDRVGLADVTLHRFRHWYATYLLDEGAEVTAVQEAMGHGSLNTTARYLALTSKQRANLRRAVHALPALAPTSI
jgi:integrase